jgi:CHAD domain-containing protein/phosphohistidine phosphatase SixA
VSRTLLVLRHAKSSWDSDAPGDFARPLAGRGRKDAPRIGTWMKRHQLLPDHVVSSPALRARETTEAVCAGLEYPAQRIQWDKRLYLADLDTLLQVIHECPRKRHALLLVGHNPGMDELVEFVCGPQLPCTDNGKLMTTAALAVIELQDSWDKLAGHRGLLRNLVRPRELKSALADCGEHPGDYSSNFRLYLDAGMRADAALRLIMLNLLDTMERNESGLIEDIDSGFLHDFRVAVRRTRTALTQIKSVFPRAVIERFGKHFAWLGKVTGPGRDLDVYLLRFDDYLDCLPVETRDNLEPLRAILLKNKKTEHKKLVRSLKTRRYASLKQNWRDFLQKDPPQRTTLANAARPVVSVSSQRIWKMYRRVLKKGRAIKDDSPADALHELRKSCKKLRYLMEYFQSLYPSACIRKAIKTLKLLQDNLGEFQDLSVQIHSLGEYEERVAREYEASTETVLAIEQLREILRARREQQRGRFAKCFASFDSATNGKTFKRLFNDSTQRRKERKVY